MFWLGITSMVALPMIGIFDEHKWPLPHGISAVIFFLCFGVYSVMLGDSLNAHRNSFPADEQDSITRTYKATSWIIYGLSALLLSIIIFHSKSPTPFFEWFVVLYYVNFFAIVSQDNQFYDSIHVPSSIKKASSP